jgi:hypothetical protein
MKDRIMKQEDQTIWYENDDLINEYLESPKNLSKLKATGPGERLSLIDLIKKSMVIPID